MSSSISRFFRKALSTPSAPKPLGGRRISAPLPLLAGPRQVTATDFLEARQMIKPALGQSPTWQAVGKELHRSYLHDVLDHPLAHGANIARKGNLVLLHVRHTGRHLSPEAQRSLVDTHKFVPVGSFVSLSDARGERHTFTWALPRTPAVAARLTMPTPPYVKFQPRVPVVSMNSFQGPTARNTQLLGLPPVRTYLGPYAN